MLSNIASDRATAGHEAAHSLNLWHSFEDTANSNAMTGRSLSDSLAVYAQMNTENVMDYTPTARSFYKWQWERMQSKYSAP